SGTGSVICCEIGWVHRDGINTQSRRAKTFSEVNGNSLVPLRANLKRKRQITASINTTQKRLSSKGSSGCNTVKLFNRLGNFRLNSVTIFSAIRAVTSLQSKLTHALQNISRFLQGRSEERRVGKECRA